MQQQREQRVPRRSATPVAGFTLWELLVVIVILGLLATAVLFRLSSLTNRARFQGALGHVTDLEALVRQDARQHGRANRLEWELGTNRVTSQRGTVSRTETLGADVLIRRIMTPQQNRSVGRAVIDYTTMGTSPTYAVELVSSPTSATAVWLLFVGTTGIVQPLETEREVQQLVQQVVAQGDHPR